MTLNKWITIAGWLGVAGGIAWLAKVTVGAVGGEGGEGGVDVPLFFAGLVLLVVGSTGFGAWLARDRSPGVRVAAIALVPVAAIALFIGVQIVTDPLTLLPAHLDAEYGIVLAALLGLALGGIRASSSRRRSAVL